MQQSCKDLLKFTFTRSSLARSGEAFITEAFIWKFQILTDFFGHIANWGTRIRAFINIYKANCLFLLFLLNLFILIENKALL